VNGFLKAYTDAYVKKQITAIETEIKKLFIFSFFNIIGLYKIKKEPRYIGTLSLRLLA